VKVRSASGSGGATQADTSTPISADRDAAWDEIDLQVRIESGRGAGESPQRQIVEPARFDLRNHRLTHSRSSRQLGLRKPAALSQRSNLVLDQNLREFILDLSPEPEFIDFSF
jgi:hypothetical protein